MTTAQRFQILVCDGPSCGVTHDSDRLVECIGATTAKDAALAGKVEVVRFTCFDHCDDGPNMFVRQMAPGDEAEEADSDVFESQRGFYSHMDEDKVARVLEEHVKTGTAVEGLVSDY